MELVPGQGHWGPDAIPGVSLPAFTRLCVACLTDTYTKCTLEQDARWRRGEAVSLKTARDSMVSLELAQHSQMVYSKR